MLVHAQRHVPYWRETFRARGFVPARLGHADELEALAVIDKDLVVREGDRMRATAAPHGQASTCVQLQTSGTTGAGLRLSLPLGAQIGGLMAERAGLPAVVAAFGGLQIGYALWARLRMDGLRAID